MGSMMGDMGGMMGGGGGDSGGFGGMMGGGNTAKNSSDPQTQKIMGWDVPDLFANLTSPSPAENVKPSQAAPEGAKTPQLAPPSNNGGSAQQDLDITQAMINKLGNYKPMENPDLGNNTAPNGGFGVKGLPKSNYGLDLQD